MILKDRSKGEAGVLDKIQVSGLSSWVDGGDIPCARQKEEACRGDDIER